MTHSDNLIDRVLQLQGSRNNIHLVSDSIDTPLTTSFFSGTDSNKTSIRTSGLSHNGNTQIINLIRTMMTSFSEDSYPIIRNLLLSFLSGEEHKKAADLISSKAKEKQLQTIFDIIMKIPSVVFSQLELLQFVCVILDIIKRTEIDLSNRYKQFTSTEHILLMEGTQDIASVLLRIEEILKEDKEKDLRTIFKLLIFIFSFSPPKQEFEFEEEFKQELTNAILQGKDNLGWLPDNIFQSISQTVVTHQNNDESDDHEEDEDWGNDWDEDEEEEKDEEDDENWDNEWDDFDPFKKDKDQSKKNLTLKTTKQKAPVKRQQKQQPAANTQQNRARVEIAHAVDEAFRRLHAVSNQRSGLQTFRTVMPGPESTLRPEMVGYDLKAGTFGKKEVPYEPLLKQFVAQLSDQENCLNITDVRHNRSLLRSLSTTFGRFMFQSKPKLITDDCAVVLIFVVGGITAGEICDIRKVIDYHNKIDGPNSSFYNRTILIGSTTFCTPDFIYDKILCS
jgi:transposase-like protein